jgi:hypothetical protein
LCGRKWITGLSCSVFIWPVKRAREMRSVFIERREIPFFEQVTVCSIQLINQVSTSHMIVPHIPARLPRSSKETMPTPSCDSF